MLLTYLVLKGEKVVIALEWFVSEVRRSVINRIHTKSAMPETIRLSCY